MSIKLIHGDCLEEMEKLEAGSVDLVLTDIPYGKVNRSSNGLRNLDKGIADVVDFDVETSITQAIRLSTGSIYIFCGTEQVSEIRSTMVTSGLSTRLGIWEKTNPSPMNGQHIWLSSIECCVYGKKRGATFNEHCKSSVWRCPVPRGKLHPTMKPIPLLERLILASSDVGDTVLDFTMGSGSTAIACLNTGRNFIGIEKDDSYFEVAKNRIDEHMRQGSLL